MNWRLWFVQLSGWPVFLLIVLVVALAMMGLSVVFTKISNRSVLQNALLAFVAVAIVALVGLVMMAVMTR